ncbi:hypothetical protein [Armatimonas rosea]|uniref:Uncharacterized protein n=1 Tax=Armatimonas rosea TaxID=685828 RepID=A0A7W9SWF0_ARMRO|nr:hypothetical protein [Armatimonas rosea]MBB6053946.1 hypothetical protein [Armatimonas rosea]
MTFEREIAEFFWPQHAEMLSERNWIALSELIEDERPVSESLNVPKGDNQDAYFASLLILLWTMRIARWAFQLYKKLSKLEGKEKTAAIIEDINSRIDESTPQIVIDRIKDIIEQVQR